MQNVLFVEPSDRYKLLLLFFCLYFIQDRDDDDEDWAEETTEEAQRRRMEEISDHAKNLTLSEDLEKPLEERVNIFYSFVKVRTPLTVDLIVAISTSIDSALRVLQ